MIMQELNVNRVNEIFSAFRGKIIAVIGDVMLDRYFWGNVSRISPEAPVPVIDVVSESFHLGGAANVASNLKSVGFGSLLCGVIGNDNSGSTFIDIARNVGFIPDGLYVDVNRPTTVKTRIIGNNQHIARLDREVRHLITSAGERYILDVLNINKNYISGIIFQDYNKGTLSNILIREVSSFAKTNNLPVFVDPKKENFFEFQNATVFKPNKKEAAQALNKNIETEDDVLSSGKALMKRLDCENLLLTLGKDGMMLFESDGEVSSVPTRARHVADVSGAGDTAIAILSAAYSAGASVREAAALANFASGIVCEKPGIVSVTQDEILHSVELNGSGRKNKDS